MKTLILFIALLPIYGYSQVKYDIYTSWEYYDSYVLSTSAIGTVEYSAYGAHLIFRSRNFVKIEYYTIYGNSLIKQATDWIKEDAVWDIVQPIAQTKSPLIIVFTDNKGDMYYWHVPMY
jgi:hypothetical protein